MIRTDKGGIGKVRFLTADEMQTIHEQSLLLLKNTGVQVDSETAFAGRPAVLCGAGLMELGMFANYEELVISNEIFGVVRRIIEGLNRFFRHCPGKSGPHPEKSSARSSGPGCG